MNRNVEYPKLRASYGATAHALSTASNIRGALLSLTATSSNQTPLDARKAVAATLKTSCGKRDVAELPVLERALCEAVYQSIARGEHGTLCALRDAVVEDVDRFVHTRVLAPIGTIAGYVQALATKNKWERVAVFSGSELVEHAVKALDGSVNEVTVIDTAENGFGKKAAVNLGKSGAFGIRYGLYYSAAHLLKGVDVLFLGVDEVSMNGASITQSGALCVTQLCRMRGVPVVVLAQSAKFSWNAVPPRESDAMDYVPASNVSSVVSEMEIVHPSNAPTTLAMASGNTSAALGVEVL